MYNLYTHCLFLEEIKDSRSGDEREDKNSSRKHEEFGSDQSDIERYVSY